MKQEINTPEELLTAICNELGCDISKIRSKCRKQELVNIRHIYAYIGKVYYDFTLMSLSSYLGNRDHTTMIHSISTMRDLIESKNILMVEMLAIIIDALGLTDNDKKNYQHLVSQYNDLVKKYENIKFEYNSSCADIIFLKRKITILEKQNRLYKSNALVV